MKIIKKREPNAIPFEDLYEGMVFTTPDKRETFYMKTNYLSDEDGEWDCVNLDDGSMDYLSGDDEVIPVKAELNILD